MLRWHRRGFCGYLRAFGVFSRHRQNDIDLKRRKHKRIPFRSPTPRAIRATLGDSVRADQVLSNDSMGKKTQKTPGGRKVEKRFGRRRHVPEIKLGQYADGMPFDEVQYLECKIILRPNHFTSRKSFFDFAKVYAPPRQGSWG